MANTTRTQVSPESPNFVRITELAAQMKVARKAHQAARAAGDAVAAKLARKELHKLWNERELLLLGEGRNSPYLKDGKLPTPREERKPGTSGAKLSDAEKLRIYSELNEKRGFSLNEIEKLVKAGRLEEALSGALTPNALRNPGRAATPAPADLVTAEAEVVVKGEPIPPAPAEAAPAPVAPVAVAPVAESTSLSGAILRALAGLSAPATPKEVAAIITSKGDGNITAKQAADALARLARTGKVAKDGSTYSVKA